MKWQQLEDTFFEIAKREISKILSENPDQTFYAVALHDSYRELDGEIGFPMLAMSSTESLAKATGNGEDFGLKYNPADWKWRNIALETDEIGDDALAVHTEANRSTQAHWRRTEKRFMASMVRVVNRIFREFKDHDNTAKDFVCYFDDEEGDVELIRKCVSKKLWEHHFHELSESDEKQTQTVPPDADKFEQYRDGMWQYGDKLSAMGADAIDFVLGELKNEKNATIAAQVLGRIKIADDKVIEALRREVSESTKAGYAGAEALCLLGDTNWLFAQTDAESTRGNAIVGICAPLKNGWVGQCNLPMDYSPLERLLEKNCPKCDAIAADELKPGGSFYEIAKADVDEVIRGMRSRFLIIRQHAVCVADARHLGKIAGKELLPAIVERFSDENANVRRLALLALSYWKAASKPYRDEARKLIEDPDRDVRGTAFECFGQ